MYVAETGQMLRDLLTSTVKGAESLVIQDIWLVFGQWNKGGSGGFLV